MTALAGAKISAAKKGKTPTSFKAFQAAGRRRNGTSSLEARLYEFLVGAGYTLEIEKSFGRYLVDVYLPDYHLAIEADGYYHIGRQDRDALRDAVLLAQYDLPVVRLTAGDIRTLTSA
jgi:very-short-patch-repair endonuclease